MNCELAQEDIVLSVYGELPDERAIGWSSI